jgi:hypothetical protein
MGNPLNSVLKYLDPIGNAAGNALSGPHGILTPKVAPAPPGYNPSMNPGSQLHSPPPGGPPSSPSGGAPGGGGLFGAPQAQPGYAPNPWQMGNMGGSAPPQNPGPPPMSGAPSPTGGMWLGRGGSSSGPQAPATATGNQGMQQQMAIIQALRNRGPQMRAF